MRITKTPGTQCVVLTDTEAEVLREACALVVLALQADGVSLSPEMAGVVYDLFEGLNNPVPAQDACPTPVKSD